VSQGPPEQPFVFVTTQVAYRMLSDAAAKKNMTPDQYASLAILRQIGEDKDTDIADQGNGLDNVPP
jgi:hypothetical protein